MASRVPKASPLPRERQVATLGCDEDRESEWRLEIASADSRSRSDNPFLLGALSTDLVCSSPIVRLAKLPGVPPGAAAPTMAGTAPCNTMGSRIRREDDVFTGGSRCRNPPGWGFTASDSGGLGRLSRRPPCPIHPRDRHCAGGRSALRCPGVRSGTSSSPSADIVHHTTVEVQQILGYLFSDDVGKGRPDTRLGGQCSAGLPPTASLIRPARPPNIFRSFPRAWFTSVGATLGSRVSSGRAGLTTSGIA